MVYLEGTLKIILLQPAAMGVHLPVDQAAQPTIQPVFNASRDGASTSSPRNLLQCFTTLAVKNFFLISNQNLPLSVLLCTVRLSVSWASTTSKA